MQLFNISHSNSLVGVQMIKVSLFIITIIIIIIIVIIIVIIIIVIIIISFVSHEDSRFFLARC